MTYESDGRTERRTDCHNECRVSLRCAATTGVAPGGVLGARAHPRAEKKLGRGNKIYRGKL